MAATLPIIRTAAARSRLGRPAVAGLMIVLLVVILAAGLTVGASGISLQRFLGVLFTAEQSTDRALVFDVRLPRMALTALVGANLAVAGVLIQTLTRNPLASPQTFGINAGASLAIVVGLVMLPGLGVWGTVGPAFAGALAVGAIMWALSLSGAVTAMKLALAGVSLQLTIAALVQAVLLANNTAQDIVYWLAGSVSGAHWAKVAVVVPFAVLGCSIAIIGGRHFGLLALDTTTGQSLGQNARRVGALASVLIVILAGSAVATCGPIGFVGLIVPHIARRLVGDDQRWVLILSVIGGPLLLASADLIGRLVAYPAELPVGIVTALIGAPAFLIIAVRQRRS
ncbi:FecCD family ABC transporter permease [Inquilinus sp.]|jgi:ABC-type Fe3+-siderophore transport system permease subunit|uniref:FecCD family ABC transporter permease n=1 Tax=Inquilinus sp. TaxID=1932117 RepID=UPI0037835E7C